ncbi:hypothetical protein Q0M30_17520, partial [Staphylococcus aureus]|nr:hypothetical protein [Staphylococcus aureus]
MTATIGGFRADGLANRDRSPSHRDIMERCDGAGDRAGDGRATVFGFVLVPDFPLMSYSAATEPLRAANRI